MLTLYIDGDACPVKDEAYRVAQRHSMQAIVATCTAMRDPARNGVTLVNVPGGPDNVDDWIAERVSDGDLCVTDDIPLASRCVRVGALVITSRGRLYHEGNMGEALATRDLLERLRNEGTLPDSGSGSGGPPPFTKRDRSRFLEQMEIAVRRILSRQH